MSANKLLDNIERLATAKTYFAQHYGINATGLLLIEEEAERLIPHVEREFKEFIQNIKDSLEHAREARK